MVHGLAIRRGSVSILCNGRPKGTNEFKGRYQELLAKMKVTEDNRTRILIPQESLTTRVDCAKCCSLMDPDKRKKYMKDIYKTSWRWKARKANRKAQNHNVLQPFNESPTVHKIVKIPTQKTCIIQISFV